MRYKHYCTDVEWLPKEGGRILFWKEDNDGKPILPIGELNALPPQQMWNLPKILKGIKGFHQFLGIFVRWGQYKRISEELWVPHTLLERRKIRCVARPVNIKELEKWVLSKDMHISNSRRYVYGKWRIAGGI
jgi:hypothetical protein